MQVERVCLYTGESGVSTGRNIMLLAQVKEHLSCVVEVLN